MVMITRMRMKMFLVAGAVAAGWEALDSLAVQQEVESAEAAALVRVVDPVAAGEWESVLPEVRVAAVALALGAAPVAEVELDFPAARYALAAVVPAHWYSCD